MDADERFVGRLWTRREVVRSFGAASLAWLVGCNGSGSSSGGTSGTVSGTNTNTNTNTGTGTLNVVATPELTEGPFFVDEGLQRSDLLAGTSRAAVTGGLPLALTLGLYSLTSSGPVPITGAQVDLWHADTAGAYSDVASGSVQSEDTRGQTWLRGYQVSDLDGLVTFQTIYPGWYLSRTIHLHLKIRIASPARELTTQLFFDETVNDLVLAQSPYDTRGSRSIRNANDSIYQALHTDGQTVGSHLHLDLSAAASGYAGTFNVGIA